jgi:hypothetical protein
MLTVWLLSLASILSHAAQEGSPLPTLSHEERTPLPSAPPGLPFEKIAKEFLASHALPEARPEEIDFDKVLKSHFVQAQLGIFEVNFPAADLDKHAGNFKDSAAALLDAQGQWLDWIKHAGRDQTALRADLRTVTDWVKHWNLQTLAAQQGAAGQDVASLLPVADSLREADKRLADAMERWTALGPPRDEAVSLRVVLLPTRKEFVEMACFLGWFSPENRDEYWKEDVVHWTQCWLDDTQFVALEYAASIKLDGDYTKGIGMNERDATCMQQQVVQLMMNKFFAQEFGDRVSVQFVEGLSMNLVIDQFGEIDTRVDGDVRGRSTPPIEVFIPGAPSGGGVLPVNSAESRWREKHGRDRFIGPLRWAQKDGEGLDKKLKNKLAGFAVRSDNGGEKHAVNAPLLGSAAVEPGPQPEAFRGDFLELLRAYKCGFIWWLATKAGGTEKLSREKLSTLLLKLSDLKTDVDLGAIVSSIYDNVPLSNRESDKDSLEGKFLIWLSQQK